MSWKGKKSLKLKFHKHTTDIKKNDTSLKSQKKSRALYLACNSTTDIQILDTQLKYLSKTLKTKQKCKDKI